MKKNETIIWVYADWETMEVPQLMGMLTAQRIRGKEIFSFEYQRFMIKKDRLRLPCKYNTTRYFIFE